MATLRLRKNQRIELLRGLDLFSRCSNTELGRIATLTTEHRAEPGEVLIRHGDFGLEAFVVVEGTVTASRGGVDVATLGPGDLFGELSLLDHGKRTATVVADGEVRLLVLSSREFNSVLHSIPSVGPKVVAQLGSRLRQAYERADADPVLAELLRPWSL